jgi:hypothetical protein
MYGLCELMGHILSPFQYYLSTIVSVACLYFIHLLHHTTALALQEQMVHNFDENINFFNSSSADIVSVKYNYVQLFSKALEIIVF